MQVESYCSRKWNVWWDPPCLQKTHQQFEGCAPRRTEGIEIVTEPLCSGKRRPSDQDADKQSQMKGCQGNCLTAAFIWLTSFLNSKSFICTFFPLNSKSLTLFPLFKKAGLKGKVRWSVRVHNPLSSQIAGHLSEVPIKIQPPSLLIVSAGDGQHTHLLFWFQ